MRYVLSMVAKLGSLANRNVQGSRHAGPEMAQCRRIAGLLRVMSDAMAELADEFDHDAAAQTEAANRRRRSRTVTVPETATDLDVQAARRALRKVGL